MLTTKTTQLVSLFRQKFEKNSTELKNTCLVPGACVSSHEWQAG